MSCIPSFQDVVKDISKVFPLSSNHAISRKTYESLGLGYQNENQVYSDAYQLWDGYQAAFQDWFWASMKRMDDRIVRGFVIKNIEEVKADGFDVDKDSISWYFERSEAVVAPVNAFRAPGRSVRGTRYWNMATCKNRTLAMDAPINFTKTDEGIKRFQQDLDIFAASLNVTLVYICVTALAEAALESEFVNVMGNNKTLSHKDYASVMRGWNDQYGCMYKNGKKFVGLEIALANKLRKNRPETNMKMVFLQGPNSNGEKWFTGDNAYHTSGTPTADQTFDLDKYANDPVTENFKAPLLFAGHYILDEDAVNPMALRYYRRRRLVNYGSERPDKTYRTNSRSVMFADIRNGQWVTWTLPHFFWNSCIFSKLNDWEMNPTEKGKKVLRSAIEHNRNQQQQHQLRQQQYAATLLSGAYPDQSRARLLGKNGMNKSFTLNERESLYAGFDSRDGASTGGDPLMADLTALRLFESANLVASVSNIIQERGQNCWASLVEIWQTYSTLRDTTPDFSRYDLQTLLGDQSTAVPNNIPSRGGDRRPVWTMVSPGENLEETELRNALAKIIIPDLSDLQALVNNSSNLDNKFRDLEATSGARDIFAAWENGNYGNFISTMRSVAARKEILDAKDDAEDLDKIRKDMRGWAEDLATQAGDYLVDVLNPLLSHLSNGTHFVSKDKNTSQRTRTNQLRALAASIEKTNVAVSAVSRSSAASVNSGGAATLSQPLDRKQIQAILSTLPLVRPFFEFLFEYDIPLPLGFFATSLVGLESEMVMAYYEDPSTAFHFNHSTMFAKSQNTDDKTLVLEANMKVQTIVVRPDQVQCQPYVWPVGLTYGGGSAVFDADLHSRNYRAREVEQEDADWHIMALNYTERLARNYTAITGRFDPDLITGAAKDAEFGEYSTAEPYNEIWGFAGHHDPSRHALSQLHIAHPMAWDEVIAHQTYQRTPAQNTDDPDCLAQNVVGSDFLGQDYDAKMYMWVQGDVPLLSGTQGFIGSGNPLNGNRVS